MANLVEVTRKATIDYNNYECKCYSSILISNYLKWILFEIFNQVILFQLISNSVDELTKVSTIDGIYFTLGEKNSLEY